MLVVLSLNSLKKRNVGYDTENIICYLLSLGQLLCSSISEINHPLLGLTGTL
jgi:hypothetical protein